MSLALYSVSGMPTPAKDPGRSGYGMYAVGVRPRVLQPDVGVTYEAPGSPPEAFSSAGDQLKRSRRWSSRQPIERAAPVPGRGPAIVLGRKRSA